MNSWIPHTYTNKGKKQGYRQEYLDVLVRDGKALSEKNLPVIFTLRHLAALSNVDFGLLQQVVSRKYDPYRAFKIRKRNGGYRIISVPHDFLMRLQKWINKNILKQLQAHSTSTAYMQGCSPTRNALKHCSARWLIKIDVVRFFESISERQVYNVFKNEGYRSLLAFELARITTRVTLGSSRYEKKYWQNSRYVDGIPAYQCPEIGHLPQGAPTSPILANLVCKKMDDKINDLAKRYGCIYTRYADDITLSAEDSSRADALQIIKECAKILSSCGFEQNIQKTHLVPPGGRKIVTGLLVDGPAPKITRQLRDKISCHLHYASKQGVADHCQRRDFKSVLGFKNHLKGLIAYVAQIDTDLADKYQKEFSQIQWPV